MARRPKSFPRSELTSDFRRYLGRNRTSLLVAASLFVLVIGSVSVAEYFLLRHGALFWYVFGIAHGLLIGTFVAMVGAMWLLSSQPAIRLMRGSFGEDNTNDVLRAARRRTIWGYVASVATAGGDVDHVVVTRSGGVLAIDSKWRNEVTDEVVDQMAKSAKAAARRAESIMRSEHVGTLKRESKARHRAAEQSYVVRPVVVVWGAAAFKMGEAKHRDGVVFVPGLQLRTWLRELGGEPVDRSAGIDLLERLRAFGEPAASPRRR